MKIGTAVFLICFTLVTCVSCGKKENTSGTGDTNNTFTKVEPVKTSDTVFFGEWNGKQIIIEDNYKFAENEKNASNDPKANSYDMYGEKLKDILKKLGVYKESKYEYYIEEQVPEFLGYSNLKIGDKIFISSAGGVYPAEVNGYYINFDDIIGSGAIFYATAEKPIDADLASKELVVVSYNNNMSKSNVLGISEQPVKDKFKSFVLPLFKDVKVTEYNDAGKEINRKVDSIRNDEIKIFKGNFTGTGSHEYLTGVTIRDGSTHFTSAIFIIDESGKIIKELSKLEVRGFTYSTPYMTVDMNGDGILEIITNDGYYEGGGYNFHRFKDGEFKPVTSGFIFGV
jgi:hypothetical protein